MSPISTGEAPRRFAYKGSTGINTLKPMKSIRMVVKTTNSTARERDKSIWVEGSVGVSVLMRAAERSTRSSLESL